MPVKRVIKRKAPPPDLPTVVREYCLQRSMRERSAYHENNLKAGLMEVIAQSGFPDGEESQHLRLDVEPVEFVSYKGEKGTKQTVVGIQRRKREGSMTINEDRALAFIHALPPARRKKLLETCITTIQVLNEDALLGANFEKIISDEELKALYDHADPTYAFHLITE